MASYMVHLIIFSDLIKCFLLARVTQCVSLHATLVLSSPIPGDPPVIVTPLLQVLTVYIPAWLILSYSTFLISIPLYKHYDLVSEC